MTPVRFIFAFMIVAISLVLPYRLRITFFSFVASVVHSPFWLFGKISRFILEQTETENPYADLPTVKKKLRPK